MQELPDPVREIARQLAEAKKARVFGKLTVNLEAGEPTHLEISKKVKLHR